jgi:hypothetical protein
MYSRIRDPVLFYPQDPGSGTEMKNLGIRDKTSRIRNTALKQYAQPIPVYRMSIKRIVNITSTVLQRSYIPFVTLAYSTGTYR